MIHWNSANTAVDAVDLSLLGAIPLELDPRWLSSRVNGADKYVRYFVLGDQQRPHGYAPFIVHQGALAYYFGETMICRIPVLRYAMQGEPLCNDDGTLAGLFEPLCNAVGKRGVVFFEGVPVDSSLSDLLTSQKSPVRNFFHVVPYGPKYARRLIELPAGAQFEDYLRTLGSKTREDVRRTRKRFGTKAIDAVKTVRYTDIEQAEELASALAQVSRKTYQYHLLGLGLENTPKDVAQFRLAATNGWLRAYVLWIGDKPIAFQLGYQDSCTYYGHHVGFDPEASKLQPGIYLHTEVMADLLLNGIYHFDFLSGDSLYKQRLSNKFREERHYYLIPRGWPGTVYAHTLVIVNALSEAIGRWLNKSGLKEQIRRLVRATAVKRAKNGD